MTMKVACIAILLLIAFPSLYSHKHVDYSAKGASENRLRELLSCWCCGNNSRRICLNSG